MNSPMRLLIITQKIDKSDDLLGFMHAWIEAFARSLESVIALGLYRGIVTLPANVKVVSLGKEKLRGIGKVGARILYLYRFYRTIWQERKNYDAVFVHMNYEYVILGGLFWRLWGKRIGLWYAHGYVPPTLHIAHWFAHDVFTSTVSGFRIETPKKHVIGQAIDTSLFAPAHRDDDGIFRIAVFGRISPAKDHETLVRAVGILRDQGRKVEVLVIGKPAIPEDHAYLARVKKLIADKRLEESFVYKGAIANRELPPHLQSCDISVNVGKTGSLDKAVLEAMSVGLPILTCNEALAEVLGDETDSLMFPKENAGELARKMAFLMDKEKTDLRGLGQKLRAIVVEHHSLATFPSRVLGYLDTKKNG